MKHTQYAPLSHITNKSLRIFKLLQPPLPPSPYTTRVCCPECSYQILAPSQIKDLTDPQKIAGILLATTGLDEDLFRLGNTKACTHFYFPYHHPCGQRVMATYSVLIFRSPCEQVDATNPTEPITIQDNES